MVHHSIFIEYQNTTVMPWRSLYLSIDTVTPSLLSIMRRAARGGGKPGHISASRNVPVKPLRSEGDSQTTYVPSGS